MNKDEYIILHGGPKLLIPYTAANNKFIVLKNSKKLDLWVNRDVKEVFRNIKSWY